MINFNNEIKRSKEGAPTDAILRNVANEISHRLAEGQYYSETLDYIFESMGLLIPYDRIGIALIEGSGDKACLSLKWVRSKLPVNNLTLNYSAPILGSTLKPLLEENKPRIIDDLVEYLGKHPNSESTKLVLRDGIRSSLTCPLRVNDKCLGAVFFSSRSPYEYQQKHIKTFIEVAAALSVVIQFGLLKEAFKVQANQTKNLGTILHDLKAPLSVIQGFAEFSLEEPWFQKMDAEGKNVFQIFLKNSRYMFELLNELLELNRMDQKSDSLDYEIVSLSEFVCEMDHFGKALCSPKGMTFNSRIIEEVPAKILMDRQKIRRVLENLFSNAVKYSYRGSVIEFNVRASTKKIEFLVIDHGQGIPEQEQGKLFQEFYKTSVKPTEHETSTGLGLAIVKRLVELHHGQVTVQSRFGKGSTFSFWIPSNKYEEMKN